ncbi:MAG: serine/threonine protein kinase [Deltaproteobacteria bacterium]|nr:serine/threonine protein kinase [Deltaproteobacteria bacterium]
MWKVGERLGRFRLDREIGQGSHGVVFAATDTALDAPVAVKILHPWLTQDTAVRDRFKRELLLARRIAHPGVCRLFDLHEEGEAFFITMEYVEGQTLLSILKNEGRLQPLRAVRILRGVCQALAAAHQAGVIHRDLKPANIIVRAGEAPMILDFGTATAGDVSRVTRPGTAVGSMRFIAPEVFTGVSPSIATDVYSLGVVAYVVLAGKLPYNAAAGAIEMLELIRTQPPMRLDVAQPDVPKSLADVVGKAMEKGPEARFKTAKELDDALALVEAEMGGAATPAGATTPPSAASFSVPPTAADTALKTLPATPGAKAESTVVTGSSSGSAATAAESRGDKAELDAAFASAFSAAPGREATAGAPAHAQGAHDAEDGEGKTAIDVQAPDLTLGSAPPTGATELPLVTGIVEVTSQEQREIAGEPNKPVDDARTSETPRPISIPGGATAGAVSFEPNTDETPGGATVEEPAREVSEPSGNTQVIQNPIEPTVRVARVDLEEAERRATARGPSAKVLVAAAAGALALIAFIALFAGGDDDEDATQGTDSGTQLVATDPGTDAGELAAADAGAAVLAIADAGAAADADAGEDTLNFEEFDAGPDLLPTDPKDPVQKRPKADPVVDGQIRQVRAAMGKKGLITGDLAKVDDALVRAHFTAMRGKKAEAERLVADAKSAVEAQKIDRALVLTKLGRFNSRYDKSRRPDIADKVEPLARDAGQALSAGQYEVANKKLNQAFALVGKKK